MSNLDYINDLYKALDLPANLLSNYIPVPYDNTHSCFKDGIDKYGIPSKFLRLRSRLKNTFTCPYCGTLDHHESKGLRKNLYLTLLMVTNVLLLKLNTEDIIVIIVINILKMKFLFNSLVQD